MKGSTLFATGAAASVILALVLTRVAPSEYFFFAAYVVLQFIVLATAWNILGGYAGYVNFGSGAFFAVGAYTAVVLIKAFDAPLLLQLIAAAGVTGLMGFAIGAMTLRLRGIFFSIATVAIALGRLMAEHPEVTEVEINPLRVNAEGALALDALVVLEQARSIQETER